MGCLIEGNSLFDYHQFAYLDHVKFIDCVIHYLVDYSRGTRCIMRFKDIKDHSFIHCVFKNGGYSPFFVFLELASQQFNSQILFDDCIFLQILPGELLEEIYYGYLSYWIVCSGTYTLILNKCDMSHCRITGSNSLISGGNNIKLLITNSLFSL